MSRLHHWPEPSAALYALVAFESVEVPDHDAAARAHPRVLVEPRAQRSDGALDAATAVNVTQERDAACIAQPCRSCGSPSR